MSSFPLVSEISETFARFGLSYDTHTIEQFARFHDAFVEYNSHTNLSSIRETPMIILKHFVDSLIVTRHITLKGSLLDIGTGGGFPGMPLAITHPDLHVVLLDSVGKKIKACQSFIETLGLSNVEAFQSRAEEFLSLFEERVRFDAIVSRATADMSVMIDYARPLLGLGGRLILLKSPDDSEWTKGLRRAKQLGFALEADHSYTLDLDLEESERHIRHIIVFTKKKDESFFFIFDTSSSRR